MSLTMVNSVTPRMSTVVLLTIIPSIIHSLPVILQSVTSPRELRVPISFPSLLYKFPMCLLRLQLCLLPLLSLPLPLPLASSLHEEA